MNRRASLAKLAMATIAARVNRAGIACAMALAIIRLRLFKFSIR